MEAVDNKLQRDSVDASQGKSRRSSIGSNLWRESRNAFLRNQTSGVPAFSLVPLAKVSAINAELSQKIYSLPAAPGATSISVALAIVGMQVILVLQHGAISCFTELCNSPRFDTRAHGKCRCTADAYEHS